MPQSTLQAQAPTLKVLKVAGVVAADSEGEQAVVEKKHPEEDGAKILQLCIDSQKLESGYLSDDFEVLHSCALQEALCRLQFLKRTCCAVATCLMRDVSRQLSLPAKRVWSRRILKKLATAETQTKSQAKAGVSTETRTPELGHQAEYDEQG